LNFFSFLSADYAIKEAVWQKGDHPPVDLRIFYHPEHDFNVDLMMEAMKTSFDFQKISVLFKIPDRRRITLLSILRLM